MYVTEKTFIIKYILRPSVFQRKTFFRRDFFTFLGRRHTMPFSTQKKTLPGPYIFEAKQVSRKNVCMSAQSSSTPTRDVGVVKNSLDPVPLSQIQFSRATLIRIKSSVLMKCSKFQFHFPKRRQFPELPITTTASRFFYKCYFYRNEFF